MNRAAIRSSVRVMIGVISVSLSASSVWAITLGKVDDFQDGTAQGWFHSPPSPVPPANAPDAGPNGVGDHSLFVQAIGGGGPGSRLLARNTSQWTGDYTAEGVTAIAMDLQNPNSVPLQMRIAIAGSTSRYVSTLPVTLPASTGLPKWQSVVFSLAAADMTALGGGDSLAGVLADVSEVRLLHNPVPAWHGDVIQAEFLADNIRAIPEPSTLALVALALAGLSMNRVAYIG